MVAVTEDHVVLFERSETELVSVPDEHVVVVSDRESQIISDEHESVVSIYQKVVHVISIGQQGPPGVSGSGGGGEVFALDVVPTSDGIVGDREYVADTVPANVELHRCLSDTTHVRVLVGAEGGGDKYSPNVLVNGVVATLVESSTKRWFTGYADIVLGTGPNAVQIVSDAGGTDTVVVDVLGAGPAVQSVMFGPYPMGQVELKEGDQIAFTVITDGDAVSVTVLAGGASGGVITLPVEAGLASGMLTVSGASGAQSIHVKARNSFGTFGEVFTSSTLTLNQTYPSIGPFSVTYPLDKSAIDLLDTATVYCPVINADGVTYASDTLNIPDLSIYAPTKVVDTSYAGYDGTGVNYTVSATRAANNATTVGSTLVKIASVDPTAYIITVPAGRMVSSPVGVDYAVRVYPSQTVASAPTLTASHGAWQGAWVNHGAYWQRTLRISDSVSRGVGVFSGLFVVGPSGRAGSVITAGETYEVGGFTQRSVTFPAFSRVAALGVSVSDQTKTSVQIVGGSVLMRHTDNGVYTNGYYFADSDGTYNPNGAYVGLSDTIFAGSNTTGTLQVTVQETA